ncbi:Spy/CpxP family protein refolding chaperone [Acidisoma sp.]|uniref:Spy/CpxP family protein refolding chaperone n=1 Tax=Acidisoma sp. TaxID=1872115 RepID=UPI003B005197
MTIRPKTLPGLALLLGIGAASTLGLTGWSPGAQAQSATAPATTVPPAATPAVPSAATTTAPAEVPASGSTSGTPAGAAGAAGAAGTDAGSKPHKIPDHASRGMSGYLAALHEELAITQTEEPLWEDFAASMKDSAAQLGQAYRQRREQLPTMNALADLNSFISLEQLRLEGLKKSAAAFTALYQTMPPAQQKVADTVFLSDMPGAPHHGKKAKAG